ncbi:hypothetical protein [Pseudonocardia sp. H11422]|uniref:hypothetical protein n=1 Tax=Pseudonocardia sp. H11422 TaxID=2835866 RepID=UPI001BDCA922|nr:hypothetical protein [Pseudonocardia sp. H11422]
MCPSPVGAAFDGLSVTCDEHDRSPEQYDCPPPSPKARRTIGSQDGTSDSAGRHLDPRIVVVARADNGRDGNPHRGGDVDLGGLRASPGLGAQADRSSD